MISIITATYNSSTHIKPLIKSLNEQTSKDFEWVVIDGASSDNTVEIIRTECDFKPVIISEPDKGIYDALNKGIKASSADYYVCIGSDDHFFDYSIELMNSNIQNQDYDVYSYAVNFGNQVKHKSNKPAWLVLNRCYTPAHSVATVFRKSLHEKFGYYSLDYKIGSDLDFLLKIFKNTDTHLLYTDKSVGFFNPVGISSTSIGTATKEIYDITSSVGFNRPAQKILNIIRRLQYCIATTRNK